MRCGTIFSDYEKALLDALVEQHDRIIAETTQAAWKRLRGKVAGIIGGVSLVLGLILGVGLLQIYRGLTELLQQRIAAQFEEPKVRSVLEDVARTRASDIIERQVREPIEQVKRSTEERFESFEGFLDETRSRVDSAASEIEFLVLTQRAENDDRGALAKVYEISREPSNPFSSQAEASLVNIVDSLEGFVMEPEIKWRSDVDPTRLTREQFLGTYRGIHRRFRSRLLSTMWSSEAMSTGEKLELLADVIRGDDSVKATSRACALMNTEAKLNKNILGAPEYLEWWAKERVYWARAQEMARGLKRSGTPGTETMIEPEYLEWLEREKAHIEATVGAQDVDEAGHPED